MESSGHKFEGGLFEKRAGFVGVFDYVFGELLSGDEVVAKGSMEVACQRYKKLLKQDNATPADLTVLISLYFRYAELFQKNGWNGLEKLKEELFDAISHEPKFFHYAAWREKYGAKFANFFIEVLSVAGRNIAP